MELFHKGCKCLDTLERHGIVDGSTHASDRPVPLELDLRFKLTGRIRSVTIFISDCLAREVFYALHIDLTMPSFSVSLMKAFSRSGFEGMVNGTFMSERTEGSTGLT